jgi:hypothetical protein
MEKSVSLLIGTFGSASYYCFVSEILSTPEAKDLLQLCKAGKLFDVQNWIASGKSISVPDALRTTPLKVAVVTGFHSLVELLASHEPNQELKNQALLDAVSLKRLDLIELLVAHGAKVRSIPFIDVLQIWEPTIIRYFIDHAVDVITDFPFVMAFGEKIGTALRPWKEVRKRIQMPHFNSRNNPIALCGTSVTKEI